MAELDAMGISPSPAETAAEFAERLDALNRTFAKMEESLRTTGEFGVEGVTVKAEGQTAGNYYLSSGAGSFNSTITVKDTEILKAQKYLSSRGIYVEVTSAAVLAGALSYFQAGKPDNYKVILPITGHGLKR